MGICFCVIIINGFVAVFLYKYIIYFDGRSVRVPVQFTVHSVRLSSQIYLQWFLAVSLLLCENLDIELMMQYIQSLVKYYQERKKRWDMDLFFPVTRKNGCIFEVASWKA